jgi:hypothetical protein
MHLGSFSLLLWLGRSVKSLLHMLWVLCMVRVLLISLVLAWWC